MHYKLSKLIIEEGIYENLERNFHLHSNVKEDGEGSAFEQQGIWNGFAFVRVKE